MGGGGGEEGLSVIVYRLSFDIKYHGTHTNPSELYFLASAWLLVKSHFEAFFLTASLLVMYTIYINIYILIYVYIQTHKRLVRP